MSHLPQASSSTPLVKEKHTIIQNIKKEFVENPIRCTSSILGSISWIAIGFYFLADNLIPQGSPIYIASAKLTDHSSPADQTSVDIHFAYSGRSEVWAINGYLVAELKDKSFIDQNFTLSIDAEGQPLPILFRYVPNETVLIHLCTQAVSRNRGKRNQGFTLEKLDYLSMGLSAYQAHEHPFLSIPACFFHAGDIK